MHGFGEHGGRYHNVVPALVERGLAVYGYDHRGHGRSTGQRGFIRSWSQYRDDLGAVLARVEEDSPGTRTFVFGHSLGSLIALDFVLERKPNLAGLILSGAVMTAPGVPGWLLALGRLMSRVWPRFSLATPIATRLLSRDAGEVAAYENDPLVHRRGTARLSTELTKTVRRVSRRAGELELPLLMLHGGADEVAPPAPSRDFFARVASADKTRIEYPDGRHEPHNDTNRAQVVADLAGWIEDRIEPRT